MVIVDHGGCWCWSFLGMVCEQSWAVEVVVGSGRCCGPWWSLWAMVVVRFGVVVVVGHCRRLCSIGWFVDMGGGAVHSLVGAVVTVR